MLLNSILVRLARLEQGAAPLSDWPEVTIENFEQHPCVDLSEDEFKPLWQFFCCLSGFSVAQRCCELGLTTRQFRDALFPRPALIPRLSHALNGSRHIHAFAVFESRAADALGVSVEQFQADYQRLLHEVRWWGMVIEFAPCPDCWAAEHGTPRSAVPAEIMDAWGASLDYGHSRIWREQVTRYRAESALVGSR